MPYKTLLTHVTMDRGCAARLRSTFGVAHALGARVIGVGAQAPWPFDSAAEGGGGDYERIVQSTRADIQAAQDVFREAAALAGCAAEWRAEIARPNDVMARQARAADVILAYRRLSSDASTYVMPDDLLMEAGIPVLFLPLREREFKVETVLFAWKNTRETRRALALSLPLLEKTRRVLLAAVCREHELERVEQELADVAGRLQDHGIAAATLAEVDSPGAAGQKLLRIARTDRSDLIVAGGFGHSRMREWVLGGVTQDLIADGEHYVLMTH
ncbi:universal stress protein [Caulobacter sp. KR2-114]|uniref:universal stress protein n=1 Tax=Caulobacter sp. KR2-114 TaxID=3400912 RepID=UPI003BFB4735